MHEDTNLAQVLSPATEAVHEKKPRLNRGIMFKESGELITSLQSIPQRLLWDREVGYDIHVLYFLSRKVSYVILPSRSFIDAHEREQKEKNG
jgi:hypothetical protein